MIDPEVFTGRKIENEKIKSWEGMKLRYSW